MIETREQITGTRDLIEQRVELLRHQLESTLDTIRQRLIEIQEQFASASTLVEQRIAATRDQCEQLAVASTSTEHRLGETREQLESATRLLDRRVITIRDQIHTAIHDVGYLFGRVEFIRRELMFEMRYGASAPAGGLDQLRVESKILSPDKLDAARKFGIRLNLGCGHVALEGYLNVDRRALPGVDIVSDVEALPFAAAQVTEIFSAHLIEHFPQEQLRRTLLKYWRDLLKPGGHFRVVAPDAEGMMQAYYRGEYPFERLREVTFGGQDYNGDFHYNMLNSKSLTGLLLEAGFVDVRVIVENRENGGCKEFEIVARRPEAE
jgi:predicted SAM-dependent methyltransferase